jgi:cytochrome c2
MTYKSLTHRFLLLLGFVLSSLGLFGQDLEAGKTIFRNNCAACHAGDMKTNLTGPYLGGAPERWADYGGDEALYSWIRNSQAMIAGGDNERATQLWAEWGPTVMNSFLNLTDDDIANTLAYIQGVYDGTYPPKVPGQEGEVITNAPPKDNTWMFVGLAVLLGLLAIVLARVVSNLNYMIKVKETGAAVQRRTLVEVLTSRGVIAFVIFALVVLGGYTTVNNAIALGRQQGYEPTQPIKFSHETHAGIQQIECQYCHDGARRSKHSVIPAANTCMNCHKAIKNGSQYGTAELTKIYASVGYDPSTDKYIENYDQLKDDEIESIYKKWIADQYVQTTGGMDDEGENQIEEQWEGIVSALTSEDLDDDKIAGPINWVRIHNLPDHAYFNHAQHVSVGKVECQTCHGPVEEMEKVYQWSPLSMGWCINCHRQTEVQFAGNEYYKAYENYHKEIQTGTRDKVTVEDIGGLECQKCHY